MTIRFLTWNESLSSLLIERSIYSLNDIFVLVQFSINRSIIFINLLNFAIIIQVILAKTTQMCFRLPRFQYCTATDILISVIYNIYIINFQAYKICTIVSKLMTEESYSCAAHDVFISIETPRAPSCGRIRIFLIDFSINLLFGCHWSCPKELLYSKESSHKFS